MRLIDLRSDTVTRPTAAMREAMAKAVVGDDGWGDDTVTLELQNEAAALMGKEAAMFVPSGIMGNQIAVMTHTRRADEVILSADAHTAVHESGGAAALSGVLLRTLHFDGCMPDKARIAAAVRPDDLHCPRTGLILLENPLSAGRVVPLGVMREIYDFARDKGIPLHLDGARIFNAAAALGCSASDIAQYADSVMFCLSKGLCAPIGSILAGSKDFIKQALRNRKMLGGGMRQTGVLAAPGLIALMEMTRRLPEDHRNALLLAERLDAIEGVCVLREQLDINLVFARFSHPNYLLDALPKRLVAQGVLIAPIENGLLRLVTSNEVTAEDVTKAADAIRACLEN